MVLRDERLEVVVLVGDGWVAVHGGGGEGSVGGGVSRAAREGPRGETGGKDGCKVDDGDC